MSPPYAFPPSSSTPLKGNQAEYQVPPPPRPVEGLVQQQQQEQQAKLQPQPYLDMSGSETPSPKQKRRASFGLGSIRLKGSSAKQESPQYQEVKTPKDPFGTMETAAVASSEDDDDVFLPPATVADPFGTLRANKAILAGSDYRDSKKKNGYASELAITNELLSLLEDFRTKSYSVKEMENMFDQWRRRAAIHEVPGKTKVVQLKRHSKLKPRPMKFLF